MKRGRARKLKGTYVSEIEEEATRSARCVVDNLEFLHARLEQRRRLALRSGGVRVVVEPRDGAGEIPRRIRQQRNRSRSFRVRDHHKLVHEQQLLCGERHRLGLAEHKTQIASIASSIRIPRAGVHNRGDTSQPSRETVRDSADCKITITHSQNVKTVSNDDKFLQHRIPDRLVHLDVATVTLQRNVHHHRLLLTVGDEKAERFRDVAIRRLHERRDELRQYRPIPVRVDCSLTSQVRSIREQIETTDDFDRQLR